MTRTCGIPFEHTEDNALQASVEQRTMIFDQSETIKQACAQITLGDLPRAGEIISQNYPFTPVTKSGRTYTPRQMTKVFMRDGFIDRYKGTRLVYPPALRVISKYLPEIFPFHKNGRMDLGHVAYWELFPTIDHVIPVSRAGIDAEENWVCCSMLTNGIKSNWTLEQLQWKLLSPGDLTDWDGMINWFVQQVKADESLLLDGYIKNWFGAAKEILNL